jgi:hypothetical protein
VAEPRLYRLMDLFAGCGGMTRGFVDTRRYDPVFAVEMDAEAADTYAANFGADHVETKKIEDVETFPEADVVIGGPPCQGFSLLNTRGVGLSGGRRDDPSSPLRSHARIERVVADVGTGSDLDGRGRRRPVPRPSRSGRERVVRFPLPLQERLHVTSSDVDSEHV